MLEKAKKPVQFSWHSSTANLQSIWRNILLEIWQTSLNIRKGKKSRNLSYSSTEYLPSIWRNFLSEIWQTPRNIIKGEKIRGILFKFLQSSSDQISLENIFDWNFAKKSRKFVSGDFFLVNFDNIATLNWRLFLPDNSQTSHYESFIEPKIRQKHSNEFSNVFFFFWKSSSSVAIFCFFPKELLSTAAALLWNDNS